MNIKFPHVTVELSDVDGNSMVLLGRTRRAMRKAGVPDDEIEAFSEEAISGDYDHLLQTIMRTVNVE